MSAKELIELVHAQRDRFTQLDSANGHLLDFKQECLFARQQLLKNDYTLKVAASAPNSLQAAILNVAAIGISLNPANQHAYLVPRDGAICLDISYRGLVKLATDSGAIKWAKVELVYDNDEFSWLGPATAPEHRADPFADRGALKGGYCLAKLPDGDMLVEVMPIDEINKIRDTSKAFQNNKGPWVNWYEEMAKKTILKRAYKSWPQTPNRQRLDHAVDALHESEGTAFTIDEHAEYMRMIRDEDALGLYLMRYRVGDTKWIALYNSFDKGEKTAGKKKERELEDKGRQVFEGYVDGIEQAAREGQDMAAQELIAELEGDKREAVLSALSAEAYQFINALEAA